MLLFILSTTEALQFPVKLSRSSRDFIQDQSTHSLKNFYNQYAYLDVLFGKNEKKFEMLIDTGSNYLMVPDSTCVNCGFSSSFFNNSESPDTEKVDSSKFFVFFQTNATGDLYEDNIRIGDIVAHNVSFLSITNQTGYSSIPCDGILGLAFSSRRSLELNLVDILYSQNLIPEPSFSLYLNSNLEYENLQTSPPASITFGGYDQNLTSEKLHYIKTKRTTGYWIAGIVAFQVDIIRDNAIIGNLDLNMLSSDVIFNTGSPFITFPKSDYETIINYITEDYYCYNDDIVKCFCESLDDFPVFRINIDYKEFEIEPYQYVQRDMGFCSIMITPNDEPDVITLGIPFFLKYLSYFNFNDGRIGLAKSVVNTQVVVKSGNSGVLVALAAIGIVVCAVAYKKTQGKPENYIRLG